MAGFLNHLAKGTYGDQVQVRYIDIEDEELNRYPDLLDRVKRNVPLPLISVNGEVVERNYPSWRLLRKWAKEAGIEPVEAQAKA